ncbi:hypothetical protein VTJ04DRAFT_9290 [Mycothermus thermophilus]|uniref:uncharacterized protein n=1 Tax=Humicola insolens TaxID=85995 RepID=UPI00374459ED
MSLFTRDNKDLDELSKLGHFLKGSSATLGFRKIRDSCQVIQQYGHRLTVDGVPEPDEAVCLDNITRALKKAREDTQDLEQLMRQYFGSD